MLGERIAGSVVAKTGKKNSYILLQKIVVATIIPSTLEDRKKSTSSAELNIAILHPYDICR